MRCRTNSDVFAHWTGNTAANSKVSLMVYTQIEGRCSPWFLGFQKNGEWRISEKVGTLDPLIWEYMGSVEPWNPRHLSGPRLRSVLPESVISTSFSGRRAVGSRQSQEWVIAPRSVRLCACGCRLSYRAEAIEFDARGYIIVTRRLVVT